MLDDRSYMRAPQRQYWSMTTLLLISLVACYVLQLILEKHLGRDVVYRRFALSITGLEEEHRYYQLITFQFMHVGLLHLAGNMFGLYFFGRAMEEALGGKGMLWLYLLSGTIGGLVQVGLGLASKVYFGSAVMGASAGVFGLIAAFATREPNYPITLLVFFVLPLTMLAKWLLLIEAVVAVAGLFMGGTTANGAHLGGMLTGIAFIKWRIWWESLAGGSWGAGTRRRVSRQPVRAGVLRAARRPRGSGEELPPAEFISREVDPILEKISAHGIHSLTEREREILEAARSKMARR